MPRGFAESVLDIVDAIPPGHAVTYGDIAAMLGSRGARAVGMVMARYGADVSWWRVVRVGGHPPAGHAAVARGHYEREGTPLVATETEDGYRVDLAVCRWRP